MDLLWHPSGWIRSSCLSLPDGEVGEKREAYVDLRGMSSVALPGIIDMHVHLRGLQLSYKEDETSGTLAALAGCVTGVVDMPNTRPHIRNARTLREKLEALRRGAKVDYGIYAGVPESVEEARIMAAMPIAGFKIYPEDMEREEVLCETFKAAEERGLLIIVHSEHPEMIRVPDYGYDRDLFRNCPAEMMGVEEIRRLTRRCAASPKVHITHVSCPRTVLMAKSYGYTVDVTPHHLIWHKHNFKSLCNPFCESKVNPPLRGVAESWGLWQMIFDGVVDAVASDHAPHAPYEKSWLPPEQCSPGFSSLESWPGALLLIFERLGLRDLYVEMTSLRVAKVLGIKRSLSLSVFSLEPEISPGSLRSKGKITPYLGVRRARCLATVIRGKLISDEQESTGVNMFENRG
ncbi:MAG: dihydroorotase [Acidilobaceae archaeon]|nr:dihydroorotase [Acidilobaceae archaeon]MCX8165571.1 dihydroorotase [Acidilobaceae archaeon]MDW7973998.1 dihydroorotase [Sulfolobales archaeon]